MAKRKKRREKKENNELMIELYSIVFVIGAILGIGKLGPVGRMISSFSLFLTGSVYMVFLLFILLIGLYTFFKRSWPDFFSTKFFGLYLFIIGALTFMHWDFALSANSNANIIFKETIDQLVKALNSMMATGTLGETISIGGGLIGGIFAFLFDSFI